MWLGGIVVIEIAQRLSARVANDEALAGKIVFGLTGSVSRERAIAPPTDSQ
jgi:hypothetical protein